MTVQQWKEALANGALDRQLNHLYGEKALSDAKARYNALLTSFEETFGEADGKSERDVYLFSVPGRSEIAGNHTDHNNGRVLAASIDLDIIAAASPTPDGVMTVKSKGFDTDRVSIADREKEKSHPFSSSSLIAGVCDGFIKRGLPVGGFVAYTENRVFKGSGLSSSAAFEVMIGNILRRLYGAKADNASLAQIAQYAENVFFGKPCGLMDQMACATGGFVAIDFADPARPRVTPLPFDLSAHGYALCIVDTGGNHADLNEDYAAIPSEMKQVAAALGSATLGGASREALVAALPALRKTCGDRAILRALHFFEENERVSKAAAALLKDDLAGFLSLINASGLSSFCYLQNVYTVKNPQEQGLSLALALSSAFLAALPVPAACRVHGGGFAGTIQAFVPLAYTDAYRAAMDRVFGENACRVLSIRSEGAMAFD